MNIFSELMDLAWWEETITLGISVPMLLEKKEWLHGKQILMLEILLLEDCLPLSSLQVCICYDLLAQGVFVSN